MTRSFLCRGVQSLYMELCTAGRRPGRVICDAERCFPAELRTASEAVDFCGHDEIVVGEAMGGVGGEVDGDAAPAEFKVGVVAFGFGEEGELGGEAEGVAEVGEAEVAVQPAGAVAGPGLVE